MPIPRSLNALQYNIISNDGRILDVFVGDLGLANTSFTYFGLVGDGYNAFSMQHIITATTLTYEATNDDFSYANTNDEMIVAVNDRTFAGAGNWEADGTGATVVVAAGVLEVTVGNADTGARLRTAFMTQGFRRDERYTVGFEIGDLSAGSVHLKIGNKVIATELGDGAGQTVTFQASEEGDRLIFAGTNTAATFHLENVTVTGVPAVWNDVTLMLTNGTDASFTTTGFLSVNQPIPWSRFRVRRVTTLAANSLRLILTRMRV